MKTARQELRFAENHLNVARLHLERALHSAKTTTNNQNWIAAFDKALSDNEQTRLHIFNLGTQFGLATEPPI